MSFKIYFEKYKDNVAAKSDEGLNVTYGDILEYSEEFSKIIDDRCLVFSLCKNTIGSLMGYIGCIINGYVPLLIDAALDRDLLSRLLNTYYPKYIWVPEEIAEEFPDFKLIFKKYGYNLLKTNFCQEYKINKNLALLLTTSGSTGSPKLVRQSYTNIFSNAQAIGEYLKLDENEKPITTLPMNYTYGLSIINSHLLKGGTILLTTRTLMQKEFWDFLRTEQATSFGGVPYTYEILKRLRFFRMDLPSIKTLTQAGGKLPKEITMEFANYCLGKGICFFVMYGQTEATARMSYLPSEYALSKAGSIGIAIPGGEFLLKDDNGKVITEPYTVGELNYRGPNVTLGYAEKASDLCKYDDRNGELETGDMAERDEEGFYYITGRKKRFIKMYGNRINLDEVEALIKPITGECACVGEDDKMKIYVTEKDKEAEIKSFISNKTGINHLGFEVYNIPEIPKNESGKTIYTKL